MADDFIGRVIDRKYRILSVLGRGAMGMVYRAEQLDAEGRARRIVALKTLKPEISKDLDFARRFLREVGVSMQLRSPHVLTVYDSGKDESGQLYYVMEFMPQTLKEFFQAQGPLPVERTVTIICQICEALAEAHSLPEPVVHRDLKPANIFIEERSGYDVVKIGDFGIAKILSDEVSHLTRDGVESPGTPRYMAPEQWKGQAVDGRTDLYALGVTFYEMLAGKPPFSGSIEVLMGQHLQLPPPPLPDTVPLVVRKEVEKLLAKKPEERPAEALSVKTALEFTLPNRKKRIAWLAVAALLLIIGSVVGVYEYQQRQPLPVKMVEVPAGEFFMGCNDKVDEECEDNEKPGRQVFLDAFKIDETEVTVAAYQRCINAKVCTWPNMDNKCNWGPDIGRRENYPINCVDWQQAKTFCEWVGKRLPTEAEWEKAARGTDGRVYPWGNEWDDKKANAGGKDVSSITTTPVGSFPAGASPFGALDMAGNVWEWMQDWHDGEYYQAGPTKNPRGPEEGIWKVTRGGAWSDRPQYARASYRSRLGPGLRHGLLGMRCAQ